MKESSTTSPAGMGLKGIGLLAGVVVIMLSAGCEPATSQSSGKFEWPAPASPSVMPLPDSANVARLSLDDGRNQTVVPPESMPVFENTIGLKLVTIPVGRSVIGSSDTDTEAQPDERPQHWIEVKAPFSMGIHEVTIGQFRQFVSATGYETRAEQENSGFAFNRKTKRLEPKPGSSWRSTGFDQTDDHPVINIAFDDATAFCRWLSKRENATYRLPREVEWEYACRAGTKSKWSCGDVVESLADYSNLCDSSLQATYPFATWCVKWDDGFPFTAPVGSFKPNGFGLYDMHGNVFEWCDDYWPEVGYDGQKLDLPPEDSPQGARITRGGSFLSLTTFTRSADRVCLQPHIRNCIVGFRVVRDESVVTPAESTASTDSSP